LGGGQVIEVSGHAVEYTSASATNRHPRTVAGLDRSGARLTLLVVDGRQTNLSIGMTLHDLSEEMIRLGCDSAVNFDGGGSTTLVYRDPVAHALKVVNSPSDGRVVPHQAIAPDNARLPAIPHGLLKSSGALGHKKVLGAATESGASSRPFHRT
jgi:Phosphodiester glycosidase